MNLVPAHVWDFESGVGCKFSHNPRCDAETDHAGALLTRSKKKLVTEADADVGALCFQPLFERLPEPVLVKDADGISKGPLAGKNENIDPLEIRRPRHELGRMSGGGKCIEDAAEISRAIVEHTEIHNRI